MTWKVLTTDLGVSVVLLFVVVVAFCRGRSMWAWLLLKWALLDVATVGWVGRWRLDFSLGCGCGARVLCLPEVAVEDYAEDGSW